jgi:uncharacterized protein YdeI (YjbR/CyaY-like superfamily)
VETLDVADAAEWHAWLQEHHLDRQVIWLVFHRGGSGVQSISYWEALDEALAFGWIDSIIKKIDDGSYARKFTPRRPGSIWSKLNITRVGRLRKEGRMTEWGLEAFEKRTGEVSMLEKVNVEGATVPKDFEAALRKNKQAWANFRLMAPSHRKRYLVWLAGAKRPETRKKRIDEAVLLVAKNVKNLLK